MLRGEKANANGALVCVNTLAEWMPTIKQVCAVTEQALKDGAKRCTADFYLVHC